MTHLPRGRVWRLVPAVPSHEIRERQCARPVRSARTQSAAPRQMPERADRDVQTQCGGLGRERPSGKPLTHSGGIAARNSRDQWR